MHARAHAPRPRAALYRVPLLSRKQFCYLPNSTLHPYPKGPAGGPITYEEHLHSAQSCHSPELTLVSLAQVAHLASPRHRAGHMEWVHAHELSTLVARIMDYRINVLWEGSGESPRGK